MSTPQLFLNGPSTGADSSTSSGVDAGLAERRRKLMAAVGPNSQMFVPVFSQWGPDGFGAQTLGSS